MQQPPRYAAFCCIWWGLLLLFYDRRDKESVVVAVELQHSGKGFTGQGDAAELAHLLFALLLLFQQFLLAGDIAAVALGQHVLAHGLDGLAGDDLAADGGLHRDLKQGAGNVVPQFFADAATLGVGVVPEHDHGECVHRVAVQQEVQLDQIALAVLLELVVVAGVTAAAALDGITIYRFLRRKRSYD